MKVQPPPTIQLTVEQRLQYKIHMAGIMFLELDEYLHFLKEAISEKFMIGGERYRSHPALPTVVTRPDQILGSIVTNLYTYQPVVKVTEHSILKAEMNYCLVNIDSPRKMAILTELTSHQCWVRTASNERHFTEADEWKPWADKTIQRINIHDLAKELDRYI